MAASKNGSSSSSSSVQLVIYDLSHGMARQLSAQFLGAQYVIDIIPHTALVVFGREYFFGGGIQHEDPHQFRTSTGMHPIQTVPLDATSVSKVDFEAWCRMATNNGRYTASSYDLLERNCNNFSHDAAREGLRLPTGVPEWILQVPQRFLSSPMGQMIRPMLQNMQVTGGSGANAAPFASAPSRSFEREVAVPVAPLENPWATLPVGNKAPKPKDTDSGTPTLDSFDQPLLSQDSQTASLCVKKIVGSLEDLSDQEMLQNVGSSISSNSTLTPDQVNEACGIIIKKILRSEADVNGATPPPYTFALMLLRVIILQAGDFEKSSTVADCFDWICQKLQAPVEESPFASTAARTMAWLVLANGATLPNFLDSAVPSELFETTLLMDWNVSSQPRLEVRQAASALAYNCVIGLKNNPSKDGLSDQAVSLLCSSLEGLDGEPDATTRLRRLMVVGRILRPVRSTTTNEAVKELMKDLGFIETLRELAQPGTHSDKNSNFCHLLAKELLGVLLD